MGFEYASINLLFPYSKCRSQFVWTVCIIDWCNSGFADKVIQSRASLSCVVLLHVLHGTAV